MKWYVLSTGVFLWTAIGLGVEANDVQRDEQTQLRVEEGYRELDFRDFRKEWGELSQVDDTQTYDDPLLRRQLDPNANPPMDDPMDPDWELDEEQGQEVYPYPEGEDEDLEQRIDPQLEPEADPRYDPLLEPEADPRYDPMLNSDPEQRPLDYEIGEDPYRDLDQPE
ncbi:MAG: hypothetical protein ACOH5I_09485 [Oligoflexus sp.]